MAKDVLITPTSGSIEIKNAGDDRKITVVAENITTSDKTLTLPNKTGTLAITTDVPNITGGASTIVSSNLTTGRALVSDGSGKVAVSAVTSTELGYVSGVTSAIQTQLGNTVKTSGDQTVAGVKTFSSTITGSVSGNAGTATKLATERSIDISGAVEATARNFDGSANIDIPINSVSEAYLSWGGKSLVGQVTPIGMSLSNEHSANRLAFINGNALTYEYSANGGTTWTDYGFTASQKSQVCTTSMGVLIGRTSGEYTTSSRTRVTLTAQNGTTSYVYTNPRKMLINISSSGGMQVLVETRTGTNYQSAGAWSTFGTYTLSGWSGWNDIPLILGTLGGGTTQTGNDWQLRLTFIMTSKDSNYPTTAQLNSIRIFGENAWDIQSTLAATNNLYSYDMSQNAFFPGTIQGTQLKSTIATGTAPLTVTSTTKVTNLNADLLDDMSATSGNTGSTIVSRDSSGNFSAGTITASLTGTASGNLTSSSTLDASKLSGTIPAAVAQTEWDSAYTATNAATNANTASTIVKRDASGNFSAGTITASLTGTASGNLTSSSTLDASKLSGTIPAAVAQTEWDTAYSHTSLTNNPHSVTASQVGLGTTATPTFAGLNVGSGTATWTIDDATTDTLSFKIGVNAKATLTSTGTLTATTFAGALTGNADTATKLGTSNVGSTQLPIYLNAGTATAITQANLRIGLFGATAIGSASQPIYLAANGVPTAGNTIPTVYNSTLTITAGNGLTTGGTFTTNQASSTAVTVALGTPSNVTTSSTNSVSSTTHTHALVLPQSIATAASPTFAGLNLGSGSNTWTIDDTTANTLRFKLGGQEKANINSTGMSVNGGISAGTISVSGDITSVYGNLNVGAVYAEGPIYAMNIQSPIAYTSTPPTEPSTYGLSFYVGTTDPATKQPGWIYIII